ncbi:MAG: hypothetical protein AB7S26_11620 [Sandaracinaceae bacterium]
MTTLSRNAAIALIALASTACAQREPYEAPRPRPVTTPSAGGESTEATTTPGATGQPPDTVESAGPTEDEEPLPGDGPIYTEPLPMDLPPLYLQVYVTDVTVEGSPPPTGYLAMIQQAIASPLDGILECYVARIDDARGLTGELLLRTWVSSHEVIRITPEQTLDDEAVQSCAIDRVRELRLPANAPRAGATVRFRIHFTQSEQPAAPSTQDVLLARERRVR